MDISQRGLDLILSFEGKHKLLPDGRYKAYLDTLAKPPVWTLYAGLTKGIKEGMVCTEEEGCKMMAKELSVYEDAVERLVKVPLNENQFAAIVSFVYNCGVGALQNSTLLKVLNAGKYEQVPAQLMRWTHAGGVEYAGLVRRRKAEGALFMEPVAGEHLVVEDDGVTPAVPMMPQRVEEVPVVTTKEVVAQSWTIRGALAGIGGGIIQGYNWLSQAAVEAGKEAGIAKTAIGPFDALFAALKTNVGLVATVAIIIGCIIVISRRISDAKEGAR